MKKTTLALLLIAVALFSFTACKKEAGFEPTGGGPHDPSLLGSWGWYSFSTRVFDEAGVEYETAAPFHYGRGDWWYDYKSDGTYYTRSDDNTNLLGRWNAENGKLTQDYVEYEYTFEDDNRTMILKKSTHFAFNGVNYRKDEYSVLSRDWLP